MVRIIMVGYQLRRSMISAVQKINEKYRNVLDFSFYSTYDVDSGKIDQRKFVDDLVSADVVLLDVRGGDTVSKLVVSALRKADNTVIVLVGGSPEIISLTRMGSFSIERFMRLENVFDFY